MLDTFETNSIFMNYTVLQKIGGVKTKLKPIRYLRVSGWTRKDLLEAI